MRILCTAAFSLIINLAPAFAQDPVQPLPDRSTRAIQRTSVTGETVAVDGAAKVTIVSFAGVECPVVQLEKAAFGDVVGAQRTGRSFCRSEWKSSAFDRRCPTHLRSVETNVPDRS
jgi:hypothetical protein